MKQFPTVGKSFTAAASATLLSVSLSAQAVPTFTDMYVFGDSLSDTGNVASAFGVFSWLLRNNVGYGDNNRFSNGPVWHEYLSQSLGMAPETHSRAGGNNYAHGGAQVHSGGWFQDVVVDTYSEQVTGYLNNNSIDTGALYISWIGGNDIRSLVGESNTQGAIDTALDGVANMLDQLLGNGVDHLLVPNLPDIGSIPEFASDAADSAQASSLTDAWNTGLAQRLDGLTATYASATIYEFDIFSLYQDMMASPASYGFTNVTDQCRSLAWGWTGRYEVECADADTTLFWDEIHPTTAAHELLASYAYNLIDSYSANTPNGNGPNAAVSAPPVGLLMLLGLGLFIRERRRA